MSGSHEDLLSITSRLSKLSEDPGRIFFSHFLQLCFHVSPELLEMMSDRSIAPTQATNARMYFGPSHRSCRDLSHDPGYRKASMPQDLQCLSSALLLKVSLYRDFSFCSGFTLGASGLERLPVVDDASNAARI